MDWVRSTDFVGRRAEQRELAEFLDRVLAGDGGVVLLAGEPGIGKSRLAQEAADNASGVGFTVAWGRCRESDGAPPLWPWMQVFRQLRMSPLTPVTDADAASRFRLFETVTDRFSQACQLGPLLIVLDDVHRSDDLSLGLLGFVADQIWPSRIGFIATYRANEVPNDRCASVITSLAALRGSRSFGLTGLDVNDVRNWLQRKEFRTTDIGIVQLQERTGGNPLFLTEMVRLIRRDGRITFRRAPAS